MHPFQRIRPPSGRLALGLVGLVPFVSGHWG